MRTTTRWRPTSTRSKGVIDDVDPEEVRQEGCDTLAAEAQRPGWGAGREGHEPNCEQARERLAQS
eukprot:8824354-Pyramimonas_sp.AAC.1